MMKIDEASSDYAATEQTTMTSSDRVAWMSRQAAELIELAEQYADAPDSRPDTIEAAFGIGITYKTKREIKSAMELIGRDIAAHAAQL